MRISCRCGIVSIALVAWASVAMAQPGSIDTSKSVVTVQVRKAGLLSAFGHDHEIAAPLASCAVDANRHTVELHFNSATLRVSDHGISEKDRAEIQDTMLGSAVLDAQRYPEIVFRSTSAELQAEGSWNIHGDLTLHGQTRPMSVEVRDNGGHYMGALTLRQSDFGITPVKIAGGAVRVKDEIRIEFDIQAAR